MAGENRRPPVVHDPGHRGIRKAGANETHGGQRAENVSERPEPQDEDVHVSAA